MLEAVVRGLVSVLAAVAVPLGLSAAVRRGRGAAVDTLEGQVARWAWLFGAFEALALWRRSGPLAVTLSALSLAFAVVAALSALRRFVGRSRYRLSTAALDLASGYLAVGAGWALVYVSGVRVAGYGGLEALLTAAHFYAAGFGANSVAGLLGRSLAGAPRGLRRAHAAGTVGMMSGVALLAAGIALWRPLERVAAWEVAASLAVLGGLLGWQSARPGARPARLCLALAALSTVSSSALAVWFSLVGFAALGPRALAVMVWAHGVLNALGFVLLGLAGLRGLRAHDRTNRSGLPLSALPGARGVVGAGYFEREGLVDDARRVRGLIDDFSEYARADFDPKGLSPEVRDFYENTHAWRLYVSPTWQPRWRLPGLLWKALAARFEQLNLPAGARRVHPVTSRLVALREDRDGRALPRGWVRSYARPDGAEGEALYIAAYASHVADARRYMNIAFALPLGVMTSVLRLDHGAPDGAISLSTFADETATDEGDQGVYGSLAGRYARWPLDEVITVWCVDAEPGWRDARPPPEGVNPNEVRLLARHDMWCFGSLYLSMTYHLTKA